jgi:hypothetical protein
MVITSYRDKQSFILSLSICDQVKVSTRTPKIQCLITLSFDWILRFQSGGWKYNPEVGIPARQHYFHLDGGFFLILGSKRARVELTVLMLSLDLQKISLFVMRGLEISFNLITYSSNFGSNLLWLRIESGDLRFLNLMKSCKA